MSSLITPELSAELSTAMETIQDTFARASVTFYKVSATTVVAIDSNYNADFGYLNSITLAEISQTFTCRVNYLDRQEHSTFVEGGEDSGIKAKFYYNRVKLRMKADAFAYLDGVERFEFLGEKYRIEEGWRRIGPFDQFSTYQLVLKRVN